MPWPGSGADAGVTISALGYYPNPLSPSAVESDLAVGHLRKVIQAAALLGLHRDQIRYRIEKFGLGKKE